MIHGRPQGGQPPLSATERNLLRGRTMSDRTRDGKILRVTRILSELPETVARVVDRTFARVLNLDGDEEGLVNRFVPRVREDDQHVGPTSPTALRLFVDEHRSPRSVRVPEPLCQRIQKLQLKRHSLYRRTLEHSMFLQPRRDGWSPACWGAMSTTEPTPRRNDRINRHHGGIPGCFGTGSFMPPLKVTRSSPW